MNNIFIVGIKGVAMANLAVILKKMGKNVSGSDLPDEFITDEVLKKNKIQYITNFKKDKLPKETDLVIYSAAHQGINNPQVQEALSRGIKVQAQPVALVELMQNFKTSLAVCGCHGKTTTSSLLAYTLINLGVEPSYLVGSSGFNEYSGGDFRKKDYFVIEADEYGVNPPIDKTPKLNFLKPSHLICTNIDYDHPDVYQNIEELKRTFLNFFKKGSSSFICFDDKNSMEVAAFLDKSQYKTFGFGKGADYRIEDFQTNEYGSSFFLFDPQKNRFEFQTRLFGEKNILNAAGIVSLLLFLGFPYEKIKTAISGFLGAKRRFEEVYHKNSIYLFDDYGHHPREIEATIEAARLRFSQKKIIIVFQPHTYSRTQALLYDFRKSLALADYSFVLPIFASARENKEDFNVAAKDIVGDKKNVVYVDSFCQLINRLNKVLKKNDVIFTMGAGDVYKLGDDIIKAILKIKD